MAESTHRGATGELTPRNAPSLANVAFASYLTWSNLAFTTLEQQIINPLFGDNPIELGADRVEGDDRQASTARLVALAGDARHYTALFAEAFPGKDAASASWQQAIEAISAFERALLSLDSPYDVYLRGEPDALTEAQERGRALFFSDALRCGSCHAGPLLSLAFPSDGSRPARDEVFRNTGLYNLERSAPSYLDGSRSRYPAPNIGIGEFSQDSADDGKFRIPSLRNVAVSAPYTHDGSLPDLGAVIEHYARGGTRIDAGPLRGDGRDHPAKDPLVSGFDLSAGERADLLAFLQALTDESFLMDPRLGPPS